MLGRTSFKAIVPVAFLAFAGAAQAETSSSGYTLDMPIEAIAAHPDGAAVIDKDIPGLLSNPNYSIIKSLNLKQVSALSGGKLTREMLAQTQADLTALQPASDSQVQKISY